MSPLSGHCFAMPCRAMDAGIVIPLMHVNMHCRAMDNAVAESFFNLLKRERIRRRAYKTREDARNGMLSPIEFEKQQKWKQQGGYRHYSRPDMIGRRKYWAAIDLRVSGFWTA